MMDGSDANPRLTFEKIHGAFLAPCGVREFDSGGRVHPEPEHEYRTCFERDRDRIVHCSAFRRLDFKTQVFVPHEYDHYRTRLTHTLEVAQIGRTLGRALQLNEDLIEAVALAHDLGHSPFGHTGESALNERMADHGHFEHNRQSLRVVDYLEHPYPEFRGLNLTRVVRECLAKHTSRYDTPLGTEFDTKQLAPLEGQLVDLADEIAYTSADLEDALAVEWLREEQLQELRLWRRAMETVKARNAQARPIHNRIRACKTVLSTMADDLIATTKEAIARLNIDSPQAARTASQKAVRFSEPLAGEVAQLQQFLMDNVYMHPRAAEQAQRAKTIIRTLFSAFVEKPALIPARYHGRIETDGLHRVVCDYIAGMTDRYCQAQYEAITKQP